MIIFLPAHGLLERLGDLTLPTAFHERTRSLLSLKVDRSKLSDVDLVTVERKFGLLFPSSVREWYSMPYATGILARYSNDDTALAVPDFAIADCRCWGK